MLNPIKQKYTFKAKRSKTEILELLRENVGKAPSFSIGSFGKPNTAYMGKVNENNFEITRVMQGRNSFRPALKGKFLGSEENPQIEVNIGLPVIVLAVLGLIVMQLLSFGAIFLISLLTSETETNFEIGDLFFLFPFGMFILVFIIFYFVYKSEVERSLSFLEDIFRARAEKE